MKRSTWRSLPCSRTKWVGEIGWGFTIVTVVVQEAPVKHEVKIKDFLSWLGRQARSPAEVVLKQKLEKVLARQTTRRREKDVLEGEGNATNFADGVCKILS